MINQNTAIPYSEAGLAGFEQLDLYSHNLLFTGDEPRAFSFPFKVEQNQRLPKWLVVGLNNLRRLVPVAVTETPITFVSNATVVNAGSGGTNGSAVVTGTTGTGTKFQANVTIAGGAITAISSIATEGNYSVAPTNPAAEPVTGGGLTGATLSLTVENMVVPTYSVPPLGVLTQAVTTAFGEEDTTVPVFLAGNFSIRALVWDPSFVSDDSKFNVFRGAQAPTNIVIRKRQSDQ